MADQQDSGLFGMFGKKHEEGSHDQPAPHTQQAYNYGYGDAGSGPGPGAGATEVYHAPPPAGYNEEKHVISQPHGKQGKEKSLGLLGKLHKTHSDSSSSSSSDEEDTGGGRKKKGLTEKIKEILPGHHESKEEGEMHGGEEKKHGLFGH